MTGWSEFALAMVLFIASHFLPRIGGLRARLIEAIGRRPYFGIYGILSLVLLVWVIGAAGRAPHVELWPQMPWTRWVPNLAMPVVLVLAACGAGMVQPFTLGGRRSEAFDPRHPGFAAVSRHPLFLALALWALSHLAPNGELAHVLLFGGFGLMSLAALPAFDAKARRTLPPAEAGDFFAQTAILSAAPFTDRRWLRKNGAGLLLRAAAGLFLWIAFLHLHTPIIGVPPLPV